MKRIASMAVASVLLAAAGSFGQAKPAAPAPVATAAQQAATGITPPADYVIGEGDVLTITYWDQKEMTGDYVVRPDGMITLSLLDDVRAKGLKPEQLKDVLTKRSTIFEDPRITVIVKAINSRKIFIQGAVGKPGTYDLLSPMRVFQFIALAGGIGEFADGKNITILREEEGGKQTHFKFNFNEVRDGKRLEQNILLKPGDTVTVPE